MAVKEGCKEWGSGGRLVRCKKCRKKVLHGEGLKFCCFSVGPSSFVSDEDFFETLNPSLVLVVNIVITTLLHYFFLFFTNHSVVTLIIFNFMKRIDAWIDENGAQYKHLFKILHIKVFLNTQKRFWYKYVWFCWYDWFCWYTGYCKTFWTPCIHVGISDRFWD